MPFPSAEVERRKNTIHVYGQFNPGWSNTKHEQNEFIQDFNAGKNLLHVCPFCT